MLLACLLATLAQLPQDPPSAPTLTERIDALIEKTNAYQGFVATYQLSKASGETGEMRLAYRQPDRGMFELKTDKGWMRQFVVHGTIDVRARLDDGGESTLTLHSFEALPRLSESAYGWLEELFPRKTAPSKPRAASGVVFSIGAGADGDGLDMSAGVGTGARLSWLARLKQDPEHASASAENKNEVSYSRGKTRVFIDLESGFITKVDGDGTDGKCAMTLVSVDLESPAADADFVPSAPAPDAEDASKAMEIMSWVAILEQVRGIVYFGLKTRIEDEQLEWNEATRVKSEKLLRRVDEELVTASFATLIRYFGDWIETTAEKVQEQLAAGGPEVPQQLEASLSSARAGMQKQLEALGPQLFAQNPRLRPGQRRPSLGEDLLALEQPILREIVFETVIKPLLAAFDEKVGTQLEAK